MPFDHTLRDIQAQLQADRVGLPHEFDNSTDTWKWAMEAELQTAASETSCIGDNPYTMAELYDQPVELSQFSEFLAGLGAGLGMPIQLGPECPNPQMNDPSAAQMDREQSNGSSDSGYYTGFQPIGFSELGKRGPQVASLSPGISIAEPKYKRPKEPRVFCDQCNTHSEGFRGPHELKRHKQAVHEQRVKKFICVHPSTNGLKVETPIARPLEKCKSCNSQTKYGTHYNAAAHLRRCHFRGGPPRSTESSERRGGEGGGDWPPMSELSIWMKEIWVDKLDPMSSEHEKKSDKMMGVCSMDTVYPGLEHDGDQAGRLSALMNSGSYITVDPSGELTVVSPVDGSLNHNPIDF
ncbi:hypothetical protein F5Y10DRAFT_239136 [Nemania abortiva]|nr:hypothetical protein F5Y10DRAFT_239136 [Nemania abortiva]